MTKPLIYDLDFEGFQSLLAEWHEPVYRAEQVWKGLYQNLWNSPEEFTNIPKTLRENLASELSWVALVPETILQSKDGETIKTLFRLADGREIEAVLMRYDERRTRVSLRSRAAPWAASSAPPGKWGSSATSLRERLSPRCYIMPANSKSRVNR